MDKCERNKRNISGSRSLLSINSTFYFVKLDTMYRQGDLPALLKCGRNMMFTVVSVLNILSFIELHNVIVTDEMRLILGRNSSRYPSYNK
jgi:hypothetical protein